MHDHVHVPKFWRTRQTWANAKKNLYQTSYLLPTDFPKKNFEACSNLNRMKDC